MSAQRRRPVPLVLTAALVISGSAAAAEPPPAPEFADGFPVTRADSIYELSEVRRGDRGIGYTVFASDEVESFEVEVLGVMEDMLGPGGDVILSRLHGEHIEFTGVIAGMSGSPVYIDGRLVGAVAYRFGAFVREPIAGITPIRSMMAARRAGGPRRAVSRLSVAELGPAAIHGRDPQWSKPRIPSVLAGRRDATPITTPLVVSGMSAGARAALTEALDGSSGAVVSVAGGHHAIGGLSANEEGSVGGVVALPIGPAGPVAALLAKGAVNIAAIGTVTFVDGESVLAFGHPFVGSGRASFPMATAAVLNTLASEAGSYKQGIAAKEVGVIENDRLTAITGRLGQSAAMVPVRVSFALGDARLETAEIEVVSDPVWFPIMLGAVVSSTLEGRIDVDSGGTLQAQMRLAMKDRAIELEELYSAPSPVQVTGNVAADIRSLATIIARNDIREVEFESVEVVARFEPEVRRAAIVSAEPRDRHVQAGTSLTVDVRLRAYQGGFRSESIRVEVPPSAEGELTVFVGGGYEYDVELARQGGRRRAQTVDDLLVMLLERRPTNLLVGALFSSEASLSIGSTRLSSPPPTWAHLIESGSDGFVAQGKGSVVASTSRLLDTVVDGDASFKIHVRPRR